MKMRLPFEKLSEIFDRSFSGNNKAKVTTCRYLVAIKLEIIPKQMDFFV